MPFPHSGELDIRRIVASLRELWQGRSMAGGEVTLRASQTTTVVTAANCGAGDRVFLMPRTASAAGAVATTYVPVASVLKGVFTITHASTAAVDKTFAWEVRGG